MVNAQSQRRSAREGAESRGRDLTGDLARWVAVGLLSEDQSARILAHESTPAPTPLRSLRAQLPTRRVPVVAEALGYLGGMLASIGLVLVVARYWPDMSTLGRLLLSGTGAWLFVGAGFSVREEADPALARLRWTMWLASAAATALFAVVLITDAFGVDRAETVVLASAGAVALESALLWGLRERPLQQLTCLGGVAVFLGALVAEFAPTGAVGIGVWTVGAVFIVVGLGRHTPLSALTVGSGAVAVIGGAAIAVTAWPGFGLPFMVATAFGLLAVATVPGVTDTRSEQLTAGLLGAVALLQALPSTLGYFSGGAGGVTGLSTWLLGGVLVFVGARRLVRLALIAEVAGGVGIIGGAALSGVQWPGFAPIFGIVTAVGLVALGVLPGRVLLSVFGSLALLVNVPWAIARFFPGEGRVPLLILVSGGLILVIAVLLTRRGDRFRRDLTGRSG